MNSDTSAGMRYSAGVELATICMTPVNADGAGPNRETSGSKSEIVGLVNWIDSRSVSASSAPVRRPSSSQIPNSRSRRWICRLRPGWLMPSRSAALMKLPVFATALRASNSGIFILRGLLKLGTGCRT